MKSKTRSTVAFAGILLGLALLRAPYSNAATLIYSNDVLGDIEPCGCRSNPLGGMSRRENWLATLTDSSRLIVDSGNLLFDSKAIPILIQKAALEKAKVLVDAMNATHLGYAVAGAKDYALGYSTFNELRKRAKFRYLGANVVEKASQKAAFDAYAITDLRTKDGKSIKVALIGLVGEEVDLPPELKTTPVLEAVKKTVTEIELKEKKIDVWVALTHQGYDADVVLAKATDRFNAIIGSGTASFLQNPEKVEKTFLFQTSFRNQYVGRIDLEQLLASGEEFHALVGLDASFNSKIGEKNNADRMIAAFKKLNKAEDPKKLGIDFTAGNQPARFSTFPKCASCHFDAFRFWLSTPHANALQALEKDESFLNPECIVCHSLAFGENGGFVDLKSAANVSKKELSIKDWKKHFHAQFLKKPTQSGVSEKSLKNAISRVKSAWAPVQCENCHGGGAIHSTTPTVKLVPIEEKTCTRCHTYDRAPSWYDEGKNVKMQLFQSKLARIRCPAAKKP